MKRYRFPVAFLCATASAGYLSRVNVSIVAPLLISRFGFTEVEIGSLFSAFLAGYAMFQALGGWIADRHGPPRTLMASSFLWTVLTLLFLSIGWMSVASTWALTLGMVLRFLLGIAQAPLFPASAAAVSGWVPPHIQARCNAVVLAGVSIGSAAAPMLISPVMTRFGWQAGMLISILPAWIVFLVWRKTAPSWDPVLRRTDRPEQQTPAPAASFLRSASFWMLTFSYSLQGYVGYIFVFWFYLYLVRVRHFSLLEGAFFSSLPWVLSMISIPLGGWLSDLLIHTRLGRQWGRRAVPVFGLAGAGITLALGAGTGSPYAAAFYLALSTSLVLCVEGPFWAAVTEIGRAHPGAGGGIMNTGCNLGGFLSPLLTPWLAERIGWEGALYLAAVLSLIAAAAWCRIWLPEAKPGCDSDTPCGT